jgi:transcriptional antiterminator RfaH
VNSFPSPGEARWFVCHTKPRCEKKFSALLKAESIEHYLPLVESVKRYGTQTKRFTKPLFPGYVFAQVVLENKSRIYQQDLLARVLPVVHEAVFLRQLADVRTLMASGVELTTRPLLRRGTRVRVTNGPLWGLEGVVDDPENPKGIIVAVDVLQQGLHVRMSLDDIEPLP